MENDIEQDNQAILDYLEAHNFEREAEADAENEQFRFFVMNNWQRRVVLVEQKMNDGRLFLCEDIGIPSDLF